MQKTRPILTLGERYQNLLGPTYDKYYGVATYLWSDIENAFPLTANKENNIHIVVSKIREITIVNINKSSAKTWKTGMMRYYPHPSIYIKDFNSHIEMWKYKAIMEMHCLNGARSKTNTLPSMPKTFSLAAWRRDYNPNPCLVSLTCCNRIRLNWLCWRLNLCNKLPRFGNYRRHSYWPLPTLSEYIRKWRLQPNG